MVGKARAVHNLRLCDRQLESGQRALKGKYISKDGLGARVLVSQETILYSLGQSLLDKSTHSFYYFRYNESCLHGVITTSKMLFLSESVRNGSFQISSQIFCANLWFLIG